ncbi:MAG: hypothetical protein PVH41_00595 [Anaerolineae bacterium]
MSTFGGTGVGVGGTGVGVLVGALVGALVGDGVGVAEDGSGVGLEGTAVGWLQDAPRATSSSAIAARPADADSAVVRGRRRPWTE